MRETGVYEALGIENRYRILSQINIGYYIDLGTDWVLIWVKSFTQLLDEKFACYLITKEMEYIAGMQYASFLINLD